MGLPGLLFTQHTVGLWIGSSKALLHRRARVPQRLPSAATVRWRQSGRTERGARGRECTRSAGCNPRRGAHVA